MPSTFGDTVTFTATVSSTVPPNIGTPTGTVTFSFVPPGVPDATVTLNSGQAVYSTADLPADTYTVTATYSGDSNFASSTGTLTYTVAPATTNTTLTAVP